MATRVTLHATGNVPDGMAGAPAASVPRLDPPPGGPWRRPMPARRRLAASFMAALVAALVAVVGGTAQGQGADLAPFPAAEAGMQRFVVRVPPVSDADARRVQLLVGRTIEIDCNRHALGASVERRTVPGWGYDYLVVAALGPAASTRMACPPGEPTRRQFVPARAPELDALRYNPGLPLVIYVPAGGEVRYRVFSAGPEQAAAVE